MLTALKVRHPNGQAMRLSSSLALYLAQRDERKFKLGHWLSTVDASLLDYFADVAGAYAERPTDPRVVDLVTLGSLAHAAETGARPQHELRAEDMIRFCAQAGLFAELERCRRRGWLDIEGALSILDLGDAKVHYSAEGLRAMMAHLPKDSI